MQITSSTPHSPADKKSSASAPASNADAFAGLLHACQQSAVVDEAADKKKTAQAPFDLDSTPLLLPTPENISRLANEAADELRDLFTNAGLPTDPPVEFKVDPFTGKVSVETDRADKSQIEAALKANQPLELKIHNVAALASHIEPMKESLEFQAAYRGAKNSAEVALVVQQYSHLFDNRPTPAHTFSLAFNGSATNLLQDGQPWNAEQAA
jgi:hypothetical protein